MATNTDLFRDVGLGLQHQLSVINTESNKPLFKKVLLGYPEDELRRYSRDIIAVCYVNGANQYNETFGKHNRMDYIKSTVGFVIRGTTSARYDLAVRVMDYLHREFEINKNLQKLVYQDRAIVRHTQITDSQLTLSPNGKKMDIIGVILLKHHVFRK
jgi:hypothetical protein